MLKLELLAPAWKELEAVGDIHLKLTGPASAERITDGILDTLECLRSTPLLGMECEDRELKDKGYRRLICGNYLCFYRVIGDTVFIYHIVDGRTDYPRIFASMK
jgi:plasmid stabilization system protein ParE